MIESRARIINDRAQLRVPYQTIDRYSWTMVRGSYASGVRLTRRLDNCRRLFGDEHDETAEVMSSLAGAHFAAGDLASARALHGEVVALRGEIDGDEHAKNAGGHEQLCDDVGDRREIRAGAGTHQQLLEVKRRVLGTEHPETTNAASKLFQRLTKLNDRPAAQQVLTHDLSWLSSRMPTTLGAEQRRVRGSVANLPEFE